MQFSGEFDARGAAADDAEVEQLPPVGVGDRRLVRLLEAWCGSARVSAAAARGGRTLGESAAARRRTFEEAHADAAGVLDVFEEVGVFFYTGDVEG